MKPRLLHVMLIGLVWAGAAAADMARHASVETLEPSVERDAFGCSCPRLSSRCEPMKVERDQGLVGVLAMSMPLAARAASDDEEETEIAELGVRTRELKAPADATDRKIGFLVTSVEDGGAGKDAGIAPGDVILSVNDLPIESIEDLAGAVASCQENDGVSLTVLHGGAETTVHITVVSAS